MELKTIFEDPRFDANFWNSMSPAERTNYLSHYYAGFFGNNLAMGQQVASQMISQNPSLYTENYKGMPTTTSTVSKPVEPVNAPASSGETITSTVSKPVEPVNAPASEGTTEQPVEQLQPMNIGGTNTMQPVTKQQMDSNNASVNVANQTNPNLTQTGKVRSLGTSDEREKMFKFRTFGLLKRK